MLLKYPRILIKDARRVVANDFFTAENLYGASKANRHNPETQRFDKPPNTMVPMQLEMKMLAL